MAPRRLTIVVEILPADPGASDTADDAATAVLDGVQPHEFVSAAWGDYLPEIETDDDFDEQDAERRHAAAPTPWGDRSCAGWPTPDHDDGEDTPT